MKYLFCPPLSDYPEPLPDQSISESIDCQFCKNKMWLSEKKKNICEILNNQPDEKIWIGCYRCFMVEVIKDKELLNLVKKGDFISIL